MAICPHCQTTSPALLDPCPRGDGFFCVDEADLAANPGDPLLGRAIGGRFVIVSMLGSGSMASVYRAHQLEVDRSVALKIFRMDELFDGPASRERAAEMAQARERFAQEARVLGKLAHPNCVTLFDFGADLDGSLLYIAMEHAGGVSLRRAMNRGLKLDAIYEIVVQVLLALREAHALEIVHRDLKPENIILTFRHSNDEPVVKVVDFGIAKLLGQERVADHTRVGALFGTPAYMSPEQCRGDVDAVGPYSDIYALGCILHEMLSGHLPFEAKNPMDMLRLHMAAPVPPLQPRPGLDVPRALEELVQTCLQKEPADRFPDASSMLLALNAVRQGSAAPQTARLGAVAPKRVVVPRNQISGAEIEPPVIAPATTGKKPARRKAPTVVTDGGGDDVSVRETYPGTGPMGSSAPRAPATHQFDRATWTFVIIALLSVIAACIALILFVWDMTTVGS